MSPQQTGLGAFTVYSSFPYPVTALGSLPRVLEELRGYMSTLVSSCLLLFSYSTALL